MPSTLHHMKGLFGITGNSTQEKNSLHTSLKFVTNFHVKSEIFNSHFAKQCSLLKNDSRIPPQLLPHTNTCLSTVRFSENAFLKVIRKLGKSKGHVAIK